MSNSQGKAFNEVRALLGRLDRSIDEARSKRLGPSIGAPNEEPSSAPVEPTIDLDQEIGGSNEPGPKTELQRKAASFGRAKPLNRGEENGAQWRDLGDDKMIG